MLLSRSPGGFGKIVILIEGISLALIVCALAGLVVQFVLVIIRDDLFFI